MLRKTRKHLKQMIASVLAVIMCAGTMFTGVMFQSEAANTMQASISSKSWNTSISAGANYLANNGYVQGVYTTSQLTNSGSYYRLNNTNTNVAFSDYSTYSWIPSYLWQTGETSGKITVNGLPVINSNGSYVYVASNGAHGQAYTTSDGNVAYCMQEEYGIPVGTLTWDDDVSSNTGKGTTTTQRNRATRVVLNGYPLNQDYWASRYPNLTTDQMRFATQQAIWIVLKGTTGGQSGTAYDTSDIDSYIDISGNGSSQRYIIKMIDELVSACQSSTTLYETATASASSHTSGIYTDGSRYYSQFTLTSTGNAGFEFTLSESGATVYVNGSRLSANSDGYYVVSSSSATVQVVWPSGTKGKVTVTVYPLDTRTSASLWYSESDGASGQHSNGDAAEDAQDMIAIYETAEPLDPITVSDTFNYLSLTVNKKDNYGNAISGVGFSFTYNGTTYTGTTNSSGTLTFSDILMGSSLSGTLTETSVPDGYIMDSNYANGKSVTLQTSSASNYVFSTSVDVTNEAAGKIEIYKTDSSRTSSVGVQGATYTIYTNSSCTTVATDINGNKLENLVTGSDGTYTTGYVKNGTYYVKEISVPEGYSLDKTVYTVSVTGGTSSLTVRQNTTNERQTVVLNLQKTDEETGEAVSGAVYALYNDTALTTASRGLSVSSGTLLGYYKTDSSGKISVSTFGSSAVTAADGTSFDAVSPSVSGTSINGDPLVNGTYHFVEVAAADGYSLNPDSITIDASWQENTSSSSKSVSGGTVSAYGSTYTPATGTTTDSRQTVTISLEKDDENTGNAVPNAIYALYSDSSLTTVSGNTISSGTLLGYYKTDSDGKITVSNFGSSAVTADDGTSFAAVSVSASGTDVTGEALVNGQYYFVEVSASDEYSLNPDKISIDASWQTNTSSSSTTVSGGTVGKYGTTYTVNTASTLEARQIVILDLEKVDENTKEAVPNSIYALYADSDLTSISGHTIPAGTLLGYHKTGSDGKITVSELGSDSITADDGTVFASVTVEIDGVALKGEPLVNGTYHFVEVSSATNYTVNTSEIVIEAPWQTNTNDSSVSYNNGTIYQYGDTYEPASGYTEDPRQEVIITLQKYDLETNETSANSQYNLDQFDDWVEQDLIATLEGAVYNLYAGSEIIDINTGDIIPEDTLLGTYTTDHEGQFVVSEYNQSDYSGHALANGMYYFVEQVAPQGYVLDQTPLIIDATWQSGGSEGDPIFIIYRSVDHPEQILRQAVTVYKAGDQVANGAQKLESIGFVFYRVADILEANGLSSIDDLPWDETSIKQNGYYGLNYDAFAELAANCEPVADSNGQTQFYTNESSASFTTGTFIYGDYILFENVPNDDYDVSDPTYIRLPWIENEDETDWIHDIDYTPSIPYTQVMMNFQGEAYLTLIKIDSEDQRDVAEAGIEFYIYDEDGNLVTQHKNLWPWGEEYGDPWETNDDGFFGTEKEIEVGTYYIREATSPTGYVRQFEDATLTFDVHHVYLTLADGTIVNVDYEEDEDGDATLFVYFPDDPIRVMITKYEELDDAEIVNVENAHMQLLTEDGEVAVTVDGIVCDWITGDADNDENELGIPSYLIERLPIGTYILHEAEAPSGYATSDDIVIEVLEVSETQYFEMEDKPIQVEFSKTDLESGSLIEGATLALIDENGNIVATAKGEDCEWTTVTGETVLIKYLPVGTYTLTEIETPFGYQKAEDMTIVVEDTPDVQVMDAMEDPRTYGHLSFQKYDSISGKALKGVTFEFRSKNDVYDPITGEQIYYAGEVIETLVTDGKGYAEMETTVPIGTYDLSGFCEYIEYELVEVQKVPGQYEDSYTITDPIIFYYVDDETPVVEMNLHLLNDRPYVEVFKTGKPSTFEGEYEDRDDITVMYDGEEIKYIITVSNNGAAPAYNIVVKDAVPENTVFTAVEECAEDALVQYIGYYNEEKNTVYWEIDQLNIGESVDLVFTVEVDSNATATEIVNTAYWTMPAFIPETEEDWYDPEDEDLPTPWFKTNDVVHQTVEFHKTSEVLGGSTEEDATAVVVEDTITYIMTFTATNKVTDLVVSDPIPQGLFFESGTAAYKLAGTDEWIDVDDSCYDPDSHTITFPSVDVDAGDSQFRFSVWVNYIPTNSRKDYANTAYAEFDTFTGGTYEPEYDEEECEEDENADKDDDVITEHYICVEVDEEFCITFDDSLHISEIDEELELSRQITRIFDDEDADGNPITREAWTNCYTSSEEGTYTITLEDEDGEVTDIYIITVGGECAGSDDEECGCKPILPRRRTLISETLTHYTETYIEAYKTADADTRDNLGEEDKGVTAVLQDQIIEYTIHLSNVGMSPVKYVEVTDEIPDGTTFVDFSDEMYSDDNITPTFDEEENSVQFLVNKLQVDETIDLVFYVSVDEQIARLIFNSAEYEVIPGTPPVPDVIPPTEIEEWPDEPPEETNETEHQEVEFHKTSEVLGGSTEEDATPVVVRDIITYTMTFSTAENITGVVVTDPIPEGLIFQSGTAEYLLAGTEEWVPVSDDCYDAETHTITFPSVDVKAGDTLFRYSVKVDYVPVDQRVDYANTAYVGYDVNKNLTDERHSLISETLTHYTETFISAVKSADPDTFSEHGDEDDTIVEKGEEITYTITVTNDGTSAVIDVYVEDAVPDGTTFEKISDEMDPAFIEGWFDEDENAACFLIYMLEPGESMDLIFTVTVDDDDVKKIINVASYGTVDIDEDEEFNPHHHSLKRFTHGEMDETNETDHQEVEFHKYSDVMGGRTLDDEVAVLVGDVITYYMTFTTADDVTNLVVYDPIPDGLSFNEGTAEYMLPDTDVWIPVSDDCYDPETHTVTYPAIDVPAGETVFRFDVTVDFIPIDTHVDYINIAYADYDEYPHDTYDPDEPVEEEDGTVHSPHRIHLESEQVVHFTETHIVASKTSDPKSYEGTYSEMEDVTVLQKDNTITYTINVRNDGMSKVKNVYVVDSIPEGTEFVSLDEAMMLDENIHAAFDEETNQVTFLIDLMQPDESIDLSFTVVILEQKAEIIDNQAIYAVIENPDNPDITEVPSKQTNEVIHQVVEFHKTSEILGGSTLDDATPVAIDDTIVYTMSFISKDHVSGVVVTDPVPEGLSYIEGTAMIKLAGDDDWTIVDDSCYDAEAHTVTFPEVDVQGGTSLFRFSVNVDVIPINSSAWYLNQARVDYDVFTNDDHPEDRERAYLYSEELTHMVEYGIEGHKDGLIPTYVGTLEGKNHVSVVEDGDELIYTITVTNTGTTPLRELIIKDEVPEYTVFASVEDEDHGLYDSVTNTVYWVYTDVEPESTIEAVFTVNVNTDHASEIDNVAYYFVSTEKMPGLVDASNKAVLKYIYGLPEDEWFETEYVIHQTVEIHKSASIKYGTDKSDAVSVHSEQQFTYLMPFTATNDVYGLVVTDVVPDGLTFVEDTLFITMPDGTEIAVDNVCYDEETRMITYPEIDTTEGDTLFQFDVTVDTPEKVGVTYFINQANATVKVNEDTGDTVELETETVSHKIELRIREILVRTRNIIHRTYETVLGVVQSIPLYVRLIIAVAVCAAGAGGVVAVVGRKNKKKRINA